MKNKLFTLFASLVFALFITSTVGAQTAAFTYQGRLNDGALAANGSYDLQFTLYDSTGAAIGSPLVREDVQVTNGIFTVQLDFGASAFDGTEYTLEIAVRRGNETGAFTTLSPRQPISSTPYAIRALTATNADNATNATNAINSTNAANSQQLGGVEASNFVQTDSTSFVRNQTAQQSSTNFNISGTGEANIFNATTQFSIGGTRVLSAAGTDNIFVARNTGSVNTTGEGNSFFGKSAGQSNTTGNFNSFFGRDAGFSNTIGENNVFVGVEAGLANTEGNFNSFFGAQVGRNNTTGTQNSFFGRRAGFSNTTGNDNSFFGRAAGNFNTTGSNNSFFGKDTGVFNTTGNENTFVGVVAGISNTTGSFNSFFGTLAGQTNSTGSKNTTVGHDSNVGVASLNYASAFGANAVVNTNDTIVLGKVAGTYNSVARPADTVLIPGNLNVSGTISGNINGASITNLNASNITSGTINNARLGIIPITNGGTGSATQSFVDLTTDQTIAGNKTFSNTVSGNIFNATTQFNIGGTRVLSVGGMENIFAGRNAGAVTTAGQNAFFGENAGQANTSGHSNSFLGFNSGYSNTTGSNNSFVGRNAGLGNTIGSNNTFIGAYTDVGFNNLSYATAIGAGSVVRNDNTIVLGREGGSDKVRIYGLGTAGSTQLCHNANNEISTCSSSLRYKTNIAPFNSGLNLIKRLRPISFDWKDGGMKDVGFGAEDVAAINPLFAIYNKEGQVEGVKYDRLSVVFVNAIKEQQTQIEQLQQEIKQQQSLIEGLKKLVCANNPNTDICKQDK